MQPPSGGSCSKATGDASTRTRVPGTHDRTRRTLPVGLNANQHLCTNVYGVRRGRPLKNCVCGHSPPGVCTRAPTPYYPYLSVHIRTYPYPPAGFMSAACIRASVGQAFAHKLYSNTSRTSRTKYLLAAHLPRQRMPDTAACGEQ